MNPFIRPGYKPRMFLVMVKCTIATTVYLPYAGVDPGIFNGGEGAAINLLRRQVVGHRCSQTGAMSFYKQVSVKLSLLNEEGVQAGGPPVNPPPPRLILLCLCFLQC